jgi:hypothetical protein
VLVDPQARAAEVATTTSQLRDTYQLPAGTVSQLAEGAVDIQPWEIGMAYAYDLDWDPSPVLQAYSAYTPYLDEQDAAHFSSGSAPRSVVLTDVSIDGRYPAFDEPAAFRALLENYRATDVVAGQYAILAHAPIKSGSGAVEAAGVQTLPTVCAPMGSEIAVPQQPGRYTFVSLAIRYSVVGQASTILYKPGAIWIQLLTGGDSPTLMGPFVLVPATAADGLFVSGYLGSTTTMAEAFQGTITDPIAALRVTTQSPADYQGQVCADFSTLALNFAP